MLSSWCFHRYWLWQWSIACCCHFYFHYRSNGLTKSLNPWWIRGENPHGLVQATPVLTASTNSAHRRRHRSSAGASAGATQHPPLQHCSVRSRKQLNHDLSAIVFWYLVFPWSGCWLQLCSPWLIKWWLWIGHWSGLVLFLALSAASSMLLPLVVPPWYSQPCFQTGYTGHKSPRTISSEVWVDFKNNSHCLGTH